VLRHAFPGRGRVQVGSCDLTAPVNRAGASIEVIVVGVDGAGGESAVAVAAAALVMEAVVSTARCCSLCGSTRTHDVGSTLKVGTPYSLARGSRDQTYRCACCCSSLGGGQMRRAVPLRELLSMSISRAS
jgi:hypothetical protein